MQIITTSFELTLHGFSGRTLPKNYAETAFTLSDRMWELLKEHNIPNKGKNIWVYDADDQVFAGVELQTDPPYRNLLQQKHISLSRFAYYKHIGPYNLLKKVGAEMRAGLSRQGLVSRFPYIEIYGHWTNDESTCETELIMAFD
jgi:hypothetical protein